MLTVVRNPVTATTVKAALVTPVSTSSVTDKTAPSILRDAEQQANPSPAAFFLSYKNVLRVGPFDRRCQLSYIFIVLEI